MNIKTKNIISFSLLALVLSGCSTTRGGGTGQQSNPEDNEDMTRTTTTDTRPGSVMHTHSGVPHTHVLPATGLSHSHNYNPTVRTPVVTRTPPRRPAPTVTRRAPTKPATCKPCLRPAYTPPKRPTYTRPVQTNNGNCHMHQSRRHCHPLPASGTNHSHRAQAPQRPVTRPVVYRPRPVVQPRPRPVVQPRPRPVVRPAPIRRPVVTAPKATTTYYDYSGTGTTAAPKPAAPKPAPTYYDYSVVKAPTRKGITPHSHNGKVHSHILPAAGTNHTHSTSTNYNGGRSSSYYDGGHATTTSAYGSTSSSTSPSVSANDGSTYIVKSKDTVFQVMRNTGVYWKTIIKLNNLQAPGYTISPGQVLRLK